jgi:hypothetical protein
MGERESRPSEDHIRRSRQLVAILLPALREVARRNGYALAVHGSLERDVDLIAAPWREGAMQPADLMGEMYAACKAVLGYASWPGGWTTEAKSDPPTGSLPNPDRKPHGRLGWSILLSGGPYLDISVMPPVVEAKTKKREK